MVGCGVVRAGDTGRSTRVGDIRTKWAEVTRHESSGRCGSGLTKLANRTLVIIQLEMSPRLAAACEGRDNVLWTYPEMKSSLTLPAVSLEMKQLPVFAPVP